MKSLELMKSIELLELIGLIGLIEPNQVNKNLIHVHFLGIISVEYILRDRDKIIYFLKLCIRERRWVEREQKKSRGSLRIKHRDSFLKNKCAILSDSVQDQNLSG